MHKAEQGWFVCPHDMPVLETELFGTAGVWVDNPCGKLSLDREEDHRLWRILFGRLRSLDVIL